MYSLQIQKLTNTLLKFYKFSITNEPLYGISIYFYHSKLAGVFNLEESLFYFFSSFIEYVDIQTV